MPQGGRRVPGGARRSGSHRRLHARSTPILRTCFGGAIAGAHCLREHPRGGGLVGRRQGGGTQDRGAAGGGRAAGAGTGAPGGLQIRGRASHRRTRRRGARLGGAPRGHAAGECAAQRRRAGRAAGRTQLPGVVGPRQRDFRLARRLRGGVGAGQPDRPRPVHALQCLPARLPGGRDRLQLSDRHGQVQGAPRLRQGLRPGERHRFRAQCAAAQGAVRPGA